MIAQLRLPGKARRAFTLLEMLLSLAIGIMLLAALGYYLLPDVERYDLHNYVANGFDISWTQVILADNFLPLIAYLVPWALLA